MGKCTDKRAVDGASMACCLRLTRSCSSRRPCSSATVCSSDTFASCAAASATGLPACTAASLRALRQGSVCVAAHAAVWPPSVCALAERTAHDSVCAAAGLTAVCSACSVWEAAALQAGALASVWTATPTAARMRELALPASRGRSSVCVLVAASVAAPVCTAAAASHPGWRSTDVLASAVKGP